MSRYNRERKITVREHLLQAVVLIFSIVLLVWNLPRTDNTSFHIEMGRPWPYGQFIAPYDFSIFKTEEQMSLEMDSVHRLYEPYFELLPGTSAITKFREDQLPKVGAGDMPMNLYGRLLAAVESVYKRGILSVHDQKQLTNDSIRFVRIYYGMEAYTLPVDELFTEKTAYEYVFSQVDSIGLSRSRVKQINLNTYLTPNLRYDSKKSDAEMEDLEASITDRHGMVQAGQNVIGRGDIVDEETYNILRSYELENKSRNKDRNVQNHPRLIGQTIYVAMILLSLTVYFILFRLDYMGSIRTMSLLLTLCLSFPLITCFMVRHSLLSVYIIPYSMLPIFVRVFMDSRTAFITHAATIMLCAVALKYPFEFITTQCVAGLISIYTLRELSERSQIIKTAFMVTAASLLFYLSLELINGKLVFGDNSMNTVDYNIYRHILVSGLLLLFSYPLMYALERVFGFTSNVTLVELSNINSDLLRRLSEVAPGTFQHSMQVSNLAAEAARRIGAKSQLVRTGALYHDIGKMYNPPFFTENQTGGVNPHEQLDEAESARIIIRHVTEGLSMAERNRLPEQIREFISTHHGRGLVKYFYISAKNKYPNKEISEDDFRYPGPNPHTTEQAILMMADAVEASSRSLKEYTEESIGNLVDKIINGQMEDGFFSECPITFLDIQTVKEVFKEKLKIIYHTRIQYPELNEEKA
ncbi:MAG: HDIG domain-containing protein [Bacteroidaceae bacterium]|nr:HDIG domain-containing protein [Bacteroidaceae bacterium]